MHDTRESKLNVLGDELHLLEAETFEIQDYAEGGEEMMGGCSSTSSTSTCSSCCSCTSTSSCA